ncbi:MAG: hypothetical protein QW812_04255 [Thermoplasmataceae archaeon]
MQTNTPYQNGRSARFRLLSYLLFGAALAVSIGAIDLRAGNLVPEYLTVLSIVAALVCAFVGFQIFRRGNSLWVFVGAALGVAAIPSGLNPAHISALENFGLDPALTIADITLLAGFEILPAIYLIVLFLTELEIFQRHRLY